MTPLLSTLRLDSLSSFFSNVCSISRILCLRSPQGIASEQFQDFIDGPMGVKFGLAGNTPYPRKF
jgi:hypothetical protein